MKNLPRKRRSSLAAASMLTVMFALAARADYQSTVVSQAPVGYWRLDETAAPHAAITTATNLGTLGAIDNATYEGDQSFFRGFPGALNSSDTAVQFDGNSQSVQTPYDPSLNPASNFSIEAWLAPGTLEPSGGLTCALSCGHFGSPRSGWLVYQSATGWVFRMYNQNGLTPSLSMAIDTNMVVGTFYHLVITFDGTTARGYVNSVLLNSGTPTAYVPGTDGVFSIGTRSDDIFYWLGKEDEVAFYGSVLSQSQISAHYDTATSNAAGYSGQVLGLNPLVYFRLNEPGDPQAANLGTLGAAGNGAYIAGSHPGATGPTSPTYPGFSAGNKALGLDGTGGYGAVPGLNLNSDAVTMTGWINAAGSQTALTGLIFSRTASTVGGLAIDVAGGLALTYNWADDNSTYNWASGLSLPDSDWAFVALIVRPNQAAIFVANNTSFASFSGATNNVTHAVQPFEGSTLIGADLSPNGGTAPAYFNGRIDEVAIFDRALGVGEVYTEYAAAVGGVPVQIFGGPDAPAGQLFDGDTLSLTVDAGGTPALGYQWRKGGANIPGATSSAYVKSNIVVADSGSYDVVITNAINSVTSASVTVNVTALTAPVISQNPVGRSLYPGGSLKLSVTASGGQLAYQWQQDNNPISGATSSSYAVPNVAATDAGSYTVTITNRLGSASSTPPAVVTVISPAAGTFEAAIVADKPEAWWRLDETAGSTVMTDGMGRHDGTYTGNVSLGTPGVVVGGTDKAATFDGTSYGTAPYSPLLNTRVFTVECWAKAVNVSDTRTPVSSSLSHKGWWFWSGVPTFGQWSAGISAGGIDYYIPSSTAAATMNTNQWTHLVMSYSTTLGILIYINGQWDGVGWADFDRNTAGPFLIGAHGNTVGSPVDQLWKGQVDEVAFYTNTFTLAQAQAHYAAALYGNNSKPVFKLQPQSQIAAVGSQVTFKALVEGTAPISLQWYKGNAPLANQTSESLVLTNLSSGDAGNYQLIATNTAGSTTSATATLTVQPSPTFANITNGLVLHLKLDNDYTDSSGLGHNATPGGTPTFISGQIGANAVQLNTDSPNTIYNYLSVAANADLAFGPNVSFSISFWINYTNTPDDLPMIGNALGSTYQKGFVFADDGGKLEWTLVANDNTSVIADTVGGPDINDGTWHHVLASFDRAVGIANTYIDGVQVDSRSILGLGGVDNGNPIALAQDPTGVYDPPSDGGTFNIDDVGIWRTVLTTYDAQSIYTVGKNGKSFDVPGAPPPTLSFGKTGNSWVLTYTGTLYSSSTANGSYAPVNGASSPYTIPANTTIQFYRAGSP